MSLLISLGIVAVVYWVLDHAVSSLSLSTLGTMVRIVIAVLAIIAVLILVFPAILPAH